MTEQTTVCRVIFDAALSGQENMDVDAALLDEAVRGQPAVRTYQWSEPTISVGHFQAVSGQTVPEEFAELPVVKRLSGGGAILHHHELTYSLAIPRTHPAAANPVSLYEIAHQAIIENLTSIGVMSQMRGDAAFEDKSFLCFSRGDARDIVIGQHKIVGSAQRRRQGAILQHGSLLLEQSEFATEFPGIRELSGVQINATAFSQALVQSLLESLNLNSADAIQFD